MQETGDRSDVRKGTGKVRQGDTRHEKGNMRHAGDRSDVIKGTGKMRQGNTRHEKGDIL